MLASQSCCRPAKNVLHAFLDQAEGSASFIFLRSGPASLLEIIAGVLLSRPPASRGSEADMRAGVKEPTGGARDIPPSAKHFRRRAGRSDQS
jgi:hypothetical protein